MLVVSMGRSRLAATLVALALASGSLAGCSSDDADDVEVDEVTTGTVVEVVEAPATVTPRAFASVTAAATGTVSELLVADGSVVSAGQIVLRLSSPSALEALRQAQEADAQAAAAGVVNIPGLSITQQQSQADAAAQQGFTAARQAAERIPEGPVRDAALAQLAQAEAQYAAAQAQAAQAARQVNAGLAGIEQALTSLSQAQRIQTKAAVEVAQGTVDALTVLAPVTGTVVLGGAPAGSSGSDLSGLVGDLPESLQGTASSLLGGGSGAGGASTTGPLSLGAPVSQGDTLFSVTDVSQLSLAASVDETDVLLVQPGVLADVELDAVPGARYAAEVVAVDLSPTTSARGGVTYVVRLSLGGGTEESGDPAPAPRPGMSAVAALRVRTAEGVIAVPASAVFRDGGRDAVWVVDDGAAERREVRLGAQGADSVEVVEGLKVGQAVVVRGADRIREGDELEAP